jgi:AcrR family transcriptional regulator
MKARGAAVRVTEVRATRDLILDAAERHFAERGFAGVSVREIATEAGLKNQASLYHHFRNKRALYEAVLARGIDPIVALVAASGQTSGPQGASDSGLDARTVGAFLDLVVNYLEEHPHLPRLIQRAALDDSRYLRSAAGRLLQPLYAQGIDVLRRAPGTWQPDELLHLGVSLYHLIFGYFANAKLFEMVTQIDPLTPAAVARQRRFLRSAVTQLLGATETPVSKLAAQRPADRRSSATRRGKQP